MDLTDSPDRESGNLPKPIDHRLLAQVVYGCYLGALALMILPIAILGLFLAYIKKPDAGATIYASHYQWQIRSFWIALAVWLAAGMLLQPMIALGAGIWFGYRSVKGWLKACKAEPIADPKGWI